MKINDIINKIIDYNVVLLLVILIVMVAIGFCMLDIEIYKINNIAMYVYLYFVGITALVIYRAIKGD